MKCNCGKECFKTIGLTQALKCRTELWLSPTEPAPSTKVRGLKLEELIRRCYHHGTFIFSISGTPVCEEGFLQIYDVCHANCGHTSGMCSAKFTYIAPCEIVIIFVI